MPEPSSRWGGSDAPRGSEYDRTWERMAAQGVDPHGEVAFLMRFEPQRVLDAGCGTGRVAIELANRGVEAVGFDLDPAMLRQAESKAPAMEWVLADAATVDLAEDGFDVVVMAGNVMIFVEPGSEAAVVANMARHLAEGGSLVAGFGLFADRYGVAGLDDDARSAGLELVERWSTWECDPFEPGGDYAVSVYRRI